MTTLKLSSFSHLIKSHKHHPTDIWPGFDQRERKYQLGELQWKDVRQDPPQACSPTRRGNTWDTTCTTCHVITIILKSKRSESHDLLTTRETSQPPSWSTRCSGCDQGSWTRLSSSKVWNWRPRDKLSPKENMMLNQEPVFKSFVDCKQVDCKNEQKRPGIQKNNAISYFPSKLCLSLQNIL